MQEPQSKVSLVQLHTGWEKLRTHSLSAIGSRCWRLRLLLQQPPSVAQCFKKSVKKCYLRRPTLQINGFFCNFLKQSRPFSKINMIQSLRDISNVKGVIHKIYRNFPLFVVYCTTSRTWTAFLSPTCYRTIQKNLNNSSFCKQG